MAAKPVFVLVSYHSKDDDFPLVLGVFSVLSDAIEAAGEMAPQAHALEWVVQNTRDLGLQMYTTDIVDNHYTIREVEVSSYLNWRRP